VSCPLASSGTCTAVGSYKKGIGPLTFTLIAHDVP
jgi:hypothetical protein